MENGVVTVLYFFRKRGYPLKSLHDFWDTLVQTYSMKKLSFNDIHDSVDYIFYCIGSLIYRSEEAHV